MSDVSPSEPATKPRRTKKGKRDTVEIRAQWIVLEWANHPALSPGQMQKRVRRRFSCGIGAAEKAYSRAIEIRNEQFAALDKSFFITHRLHLYEAAVADKRYSAANQIWTKLEELAGVRQPQAVNLGIGVNAFLGGPGNRFAAMPMDELLRQAGVADDIIQRAIDNGLLGAPMNGHAIDAKSVEKPK